MNEKSERAIFVSLAAMSLILFGLKLLSRDLVSNQLSYLLLTVASCSCIFALTYFIGRSVREISVSSFLDGSRSGDVAILKGRKDTILIKGFEVIEGPDPDPKYSQSESRSPQAQTPLEALVRVGVQARIITSVSTPSNIISSSAGNDIERQGLIRTVVLVFEKCESSESAEARNILDRQCEVAKSAMLTSTRNCRVNQLIGEALLDYLEGLYLYDHRNQGVRQAATFLRSVSLAHFQDGRFIDIVGGSFIPPPQNTERIHLGNTLYAGVMGPDCTIPLSSLSRHVTIFGCTGAGKSNTAKALLMTLVNRDIPVLVLDFHNEYLGLMAAIGGLAIRFGGECHIDLLNPVDAGNFIDHVTVVADVFDHAYHFTASQQFVFREALMRTFASCTLGGNRPTLEDVVNEIERYETKTFYEHETKFALLRRLKPLIEGEGRKAFVNGRPMNVHELSKRPCALAFGDLKNTGLRKLAATMILALLYELRLSEGASPIRHATIIEESQNVLPYRLRTEEATIIERMFFEMRKYGECLVLLAQFPTQIFPDVTKSAGTKLVHRLTEAGEAELIMDVMGLGRNLYSQLKYLPEGRAIALIEGLSYPITIQIPLAESYSPPSRLQPVHSIDTA